MLCVLVLRFGSQRAYRRLHANRKSPRLNDIEHNVAVNISLGELNFHLKFGAFAFQAHAIQFEYTPTSYDCHSKSIKHQIRQPLGSYAKHLIDIVGVWWVCLRTFDGGPPLCRWCVSRHQNSKYSRPPVDIIFAVKWCTVASTNPKIEAEKEFESNLWNDSMVLRRCIYLGLHLHGFCLIVLRSIANILHCNSSGRRAKERMAWGLYCLDSLLIV